MRGKKPYWEIRVHGESIIPRDFKSFAWGKCDIAKACFKKSWRFCAIFGFYFALSLSFASFLSLASSPLSIPLIEWGWLLSLLKHSSAHRYYQSLTVHLKIPSVSECKCVLQSVSVRKQRFCMIDWFCNTVFHITSALHQPAQGMQLLSNGGPGFMTSKIIILCPPTGTCHSKCLANSWLR